MLVCFPSHCCYLDVLTGSTFDGRHEPATAQDTKYTAVLVLPFWLGHCGGNLDFGA